MSTVKVLAERVLAEFSAGARGDTVRVRIVEYEKGGPRLDVRRFFTDNAGQQVPTSRGVGLKPEWIPAIREALDELEIELRARAARSACA